jgi:hypothetical protein
MRSGYSKDNTACQMRKLNKENSPAEALSAQSTGKEHGA